MVSWHWERMRLSRCSSGLPLVPRVIFTGSPGPNAPFRYCTRPKWSLLYHVSFAVPSGPDSSDIMWLVRPGYWFGVAIAS